MTEPDKPWDPWMRLADNHERRARLWRLAYHIAVAVAVVVVAITGGVLGTLFS